MEGTQILIARKAAKPVVSQEALRRKLGLVCRGTLTDIEAGNVDVTDSFIFKAISAVKEIEAKEAA